MYELKKNGNLFMSKFVWTGPSSYEKRIYRTAVSQRLRNTGLEDHGSVHGSTDAITSAMGKTDVLGEMHAYVL